MDPRIVSKNGNAKQKTGLAHWMERVLKECEKAEEEFASDPVHDLRVAFRRCRSMADGLMAIDPDKSWKRMKKAAKPVFQSLGSLRDVQVLKEWLDRLGVPADPVGQQLRAHLDNQELQLKKHAQMALQGFDRKQWQRWADELPRRAARIPLGSDVFRHLALERWSGARELQRQALRNRSQTALHQLRIGIKHFRYTVENFLPEQHDKWSDDLKQLQDWLGDVHDLDVLWATAFEIKALSDIETRARWRSIVAEQRKHRIDKYRQRMLGPDSLWKIWRSELPKGAEIRAAGLERLKIWAAFLDPDFRHSQLVARLAVQIYDALDADKQTNSEAQDLRSILLASALLHDVGLSRTARNHHKVSRRLIEALNPPLGWTQHDLKLVAMIARYHRGALPEPRHTEFSTLPADQQATALKLAGIVRLANAFDTERDGRTRQLKVTNQDGTLAVYAQAYSPYSASAETIAASRFLLERSLGSPIVVKRLVQRTRRPVSKKSTSSTRSQNQIASARRQTPA